MTDIIIYTNEETLLHKQGRLPVDEDYSTSGYYFWEFSRMPKNIKEKDRIYFATKGFIKGYFIIDEITDDSIEWNCKSWKDITPIPCTHFQGFKYANKIPELTKEEENGKKN